MATTGTEQLPLRDEHDIVLARQAVRRLSQGLGFGIVDQTKIVTATSELARNAVVYGLGGTLHCETLFENGRNGLRLRFVDQGPGIEDLEKALTDGYSTGGGLGLGLSGARRLSNEFTIDSAPGKGTRIMIARWR